MATPKTERLCEIILSGSSLSCWRKASHPRVMERAEHRTHWTDEVNSSLLVSILTAQGRRTLPATPNHRGVHSMRQREEREQAGAAGDRLCSTKRAWCPQEVITGLSEYLQLAENWSPLSREKKELCLIPTVRSRVRMGWQATWGPFCFRCHSNT